MWASCERGPQPACWLGHEAPPPAFPRPNRPTLLSLPQSRHRLAVASLFSSKQGAIFPLPTENRQYDAHIHPEAILCGLSAYHFWPCFSLLPFSRRHNNRPRTLRSSSLASAKPRPHSTPPGSSTPATTLPAPPPPSSTPPA